MLDVKKEEIIYLSGPMTGIEEYNFPAFNEAAKLLRDDGYTVFNPAESFEGITTLPWSTYMRHDIEAVLKATMVVTLPNWSNSTGAKLEVSVAVALGLPIYSFSAHGTYYRLIDLSAAHNVQSRTIINDLLKAVGPLPAQAKYKNILFEADAAVHGDRGNDYGHPIKDFSRTAAMWTGLFQDKLKPKEKFTARDVPLAMNCVKMSREMNKPKRDNRVDGAGYWETLDMVDNYDGV